MLTIAVDAYGDPPGPLPSTSSARGFADLVVGDRGGTIIEHVAANSAADVRAALARWAQRDGPAASVVYLVGHGESDGVEHSFLVPAAGGEDRIRTRTFADVVVQERQLRQDDVESWVLVILDCCASDVGVVNLQNELTKYAFKLPKRWELWPVTPSGATHSGAFVQRFREALATFEVNDEVIELHEVMRRMGEYLGGLEAAGNLPRRAALRNPHGSGKPVTINLDAQAELRRVIDQLDASMRSHFVTKAQGTELGDVAWHFTGRTRELRAVTDWLRDAANGLLVVTGDAGAGKSALLGHVAVLADSDLVDGYVASGVAPQLADAPRPPEHVFDAVVHLTGKTLSETVRDIARAVGASDDVVSTDHLVDALSAKGETVTILADALDESQQPAQVADLLRTVCTSGAVRALVGTRRSVDEGPDRPARPDQRDLLDALDASDDELVVLGRERDAIAEYVERRLGVAGGLQAPVASAVAALVADRDEPFLFARLITAELLARAEPVDPRDQAFAALLDGGHRGLFAAAVERLGQANPAVVALLHALALSRGRGLPESDGVWVACARAVRPDLDVPDRAVRVATDPEGPVAPYIVLDGEAGQSTYRLAHQTFSEHFRSLPETANDHRRIAAALRELVERGGGWEHANSYIVRYLAEHLVADADRAAVDSHAVERLAGDLQWIAQLVQRFGIDSTLPVLAALDTMVSMLTRGIAHGLRRSRVALARDPDQLAAHLHARQLIDDDIDVSPIAPSVWLRTRGPRLDWLSEFDATVPLAGRVRAVAFTRDARTLSAGVDERVVTWDPRTSGTEQRVLHSPIGRITGLAYDPNNEDRLAVVAGYDGAAVVLDSRSGRTVAGPVRFDGYAGSVGLGQLGGQPCIAVNAGLVLRVWSLAEKAEPRLVLEEPIDSLAAVGDYGGHLAIARPGDGTASVELVRLDTGSVEVTIDGDASPLTLLTAPRGAGPIAAVYEYGTTIVWESDHDRTRYDSLLARAWIHPRAIAVSRLGDTRVLAVAPDDDDAPRVELLAPNEWQGPIDADSEITDVVALFERADDEVFAVGGLPLRAWAAQPTDETEYPVLTPELAALGLFGDASFATPALLADKNEPAGTREAAITLDPDDPSSWPQSAIDYNAFDRHPAKAKGSYLGTVWVSDAITGEHLSGPFVEVPDSLVVRRYAKGGPNRVDSVAIGTRRGQPVVARAYEGRLTMWDAQGNPTPTPLPYDHAGYVVAVALGSINGDDVLITGARDGDVTLWQLDPPKRVTAMTLDEPIDEVWVVRGASIVAARTVKANLYLFDVVTTADGGP